ncbi:MAG: D-aminoacyl-tRNA deacylase [bacterium]
MRVLLQRVSEAWLEIEGDPTPRMGAGMVALVGFGEGDREEWLRPMAAKMAGLRIFEDADGRMNLSLADCGGSLLLVPQFTLYADCRKGRRPGFGAALEPGLAEPFFITFAAICREQAPRMMVGQFGANMKVHLVNDGPVTILLDSTELGLAAG